MRSRLFLGLVQFLADVVAFVLVASRNGNARQFLSPTAILVGVLTSVPTPSAAESAPAWLSLGGQASTQAVDSVPLDLALDDDRYPNEARDVPSVPPIANANDLVAVSAAWRRALETLAKQTGADRSKPATPAGGPLQVHPDNPRYFTDGTGKAIDLTGSHMGWELQDHSWGREHRFSIACAPA